MAVDFVGGTFAKETAAAPVTQDIVMSFVPKVLVMWTAGSATAANTWTASFRYAMGWYDGVTARSCSIASQDAVTDANTSKRMAAKGLTIIEWGQTLRAECDVAFLPGGGARLTWTTNNASAYQIHWFALGGADCSAKIVQWLRDGSLNGLQSVAGVGFESNLVFHMGIAGTSATLPSTSAGGAMSYGVADAALNQHGWAYTSQDAAGTMSVDRIWSEAACIGRLNQADGSITDQTSHYSMDSDGFTVDNFDVGNSFYMVSLCLNVPNAKVGTVAKTTSAATVAQAITGLVFTPSIAGFNSVGATTSGTASHARIATGLYLTGTEASSIIQEQDGSVTSNVDSRDSNTKAIMLADNNTVTITAEADGVSLALDTINLSFTTNDAVADRIGWWAIGDRGVPNAISGLTARARGDCDASGLPGIDLAWTQPNPATSFVSYDVYRRQPDNADDPGWVHIAHLTTLAIPRYTDFNVASRTVYQYAVVWNDDPIPATDTSTYQNPPKLGYVKFDHSYLHAVVPNATSANPSWVRVESFESTVSPRMQVAEFDVWGRDVPTYQFGEGFTKAITVRALPHVRRDRTQIDKLWSLMKGQKGSQGYVLCFRPGVDRKRYFVALTGAPYNAVDQASWDSSLTLAEAYYDEVPAI